MIAALELGTVRTAKASTPPCRDCGVEAVFAAGDKRGGTVTMTVLMRDGWVSLCWRCYFKRGLCVEVGG